MYRTNYVCCNNLPNLNYCHNIPSNDGTFDCYPTCCYSTCDYSTCCYCITCKQHAKKFPISYKKLEPLSSRVTKSEPFLKAKSQTKVKVKSVRPLQRERPSKKVFPEISDKNKDCDAKTKPTETPKISTGLSRADYATTSDCVRLILSESAVATKSNEDCKALCDSCCQYQCSCKSLEENCTGKQQLDFKQIHQDDVKQSSNYNCQQQQNVADDTHTPTHSTKSGNMQNKYFNQNCIENPLKCYCICCRNNSSNLNDGGSTFRPPKEKRQKQKSLQESCTDFQNSICENILECVQDSLNCKLDEFSRKAIEYFECLGRKLESNEATMGCLFVELIEKTTEINKLYFEKLHSILKDLVANQRQNKTASCQNKETQCEEEEEGDIELYGNDIKLLRCGCCQCCCYCTSAVDNVESKNKTRGNDLGVRKSGGCINHEENKCGLTDEIKFWGLPMKCCKETSPKTLSSREAKPQHNTTLFERGSTISSTFTTFSLTPTGRTIFNCNCSADSLDGGSKKTSSCNLKGIDGKKEKHLKFDCRNLRNDYVSELEDNRKQSPCSSSGRIKLQKKASSKYEHSEQTSGSSISKIIGW